MYAACCLFYMQSYEEAEKEVEKYDSAGSDLERRIRDAQTPAAMNAKRKQLQEELGQKGGLGLLSDDELLKKIEDDVREGRRAAGRGDGLCGIGCCSTAPISGTTKIS